ncbi:GTP-binding protein [Tropicibacter sp. R16_0]|uniref:CobW family GTP-binding protein n=1 Tax=Tropicibacter sp. R16_0 TaxID=2821102 RepID=UPI001AD9823D|nr:GTP-binding protein [Tropicibacter sp. R16_0]MBO9453129.1 GTP-binding protein [Tropicibacter sp. R16_0]
MDTVTQSPVPLTILTGFLGAGKTTLLNHILTGDHGLKVGILVNDFGSINVDAELVVDVEDGMISLANGCVCCQIRDDLIESVSDLLDRDDPVEYIILEASGVADPAGIYMTFVDSAYRDKIRLDSVTCVVDADQVFSYDDPDLAKLKLQQIGFADLVILNKVDLAGVEGSAKVKRWIESHFTRVRLVPAINCEVPLDILLAVGRFDVEPAMSGRESHDHHDHHHHEHDHNHGSFFNTWSYQTDVPVSRSALERMVKRELPGNIYRCKGFVRIAEDPEHRYVLQVVGRRMDLSKDRPWGSDTPQSRIVAIAHKSTLNGEHLKALFDACATPAPQRTASRNAAAAAG